MIDPKDRIAEIDTLAPAIKSPALAAYLSTEVARLTAKLISADDEQTRGAIHALTALINLPAALQSERDYIAAALSEKSDAA